MKLVVLFGHTNCVRSKTDDRSPLKGGGVSQTMMQFGSPTRAHSLMPQNLYGNDPSAASVQQIKSELTPTGSGVINADRGTSRSAPGSGRGESLEGNSSVGVFSPLMTKRLKVFGSSGTSGIGILRSPHGSGRSRDRANAVKLKKKSADGDTYPVGRLMDLAGMIEVRFNFDGVV